MAQQIEPLTALRAIRDSRTLECTHRMVLIALVMRADDAWRCYPSVATIADDAGIVKSTATAALRALRDAGLVQWEPVFDAAKGKHKPNTYQLVMDAIMALGVPRPSGYTGNRGIPAAGGGVPRPSGEGTPVIGHDLPIELPIVNCPEERESAEPPQLSLEPPVDSVRKSRKKPDPSDGIVDAVLAHWAKNKTLFPAREPKVTDAYRKLVRKRLSEGFTQADLEAAVDGCARNEWNVKNCHKYPDLIFRDTKIQRFIACGRGEADPNRSGVAKSSGRMVQPVGEETASWLQNALPVEPWPTRSRSCRMHSAPLLPGIPGRPSV